MPNIMDEGSQHMSRSLVVGIYMVIIAACLIGNLAVIFIVVIRPVLHTSTSYFLLSLSIADLCVGVVVVSLTLIHKLNINYAAEFGSLACVVPPYIELVCVTASVYSLLCVSIDRYRAIVLARKPSRDIMLVLNFLAVWAWSFLYAGKIFLQDYLTANSGGDRGTNSTSAILIRGGNEGDNNSVDTSFCSLLVEEDSADMPYRIADLIVLFVLPVVVMTFVLLQIRRRLWGSSVGVTTNVRKKRAVIRFLTFDILIFVLCWLPFYMIDIVSDTVKIVNDDPEEVDENEAYSILRFSFIVLALSNSFLNPLIYAFFNKNFINEVRAMMSKSKHCRCTKNKVKPMITEDTQASAVPAGRGSGST